MNEVTGELLSPEPAVETLLAAGAAQADPHYVTADDPVIAAAYVVPAGYEVRTVNLEQIRAPYRDRPARKTGTVTVRTVGSLLDYHAKHGLPDSELWVSTGQVVDVINAHGNTHAGWSDHRAILELTHSPEWQRWTGISGELLPQDRFADFLESAAGDVVHPDMATMLEIAQSLEATTKADFESAYRTKDGQRAFRYKETTNAKAGQRGELEIPDRIVLQLRIYIGQDPVNVTARFRYRITPDGLGLGIVIDRVAELIESALDDIAEQIRDAIAGSGNVLIGTPPRS